MTEDRKRKEQLTEYVSTVWRFHSIDEIQRRFVHRTMEETLAEVGRLADPMLNENCSKWLAMEILTESRYLDREYLDRDLLIRLGH